MGKVDIITSSSGERMVVIPLDDYERLIASAEDAGDIAAHDRYKARLAAGEEDQIPSIFVDRLLAGESPVRVWREFRGFQVRELAAAAGLSAPYLSQIEAGQREGSISTMKKIADALRVRIDDLV